MLTQKNNAGDTPLHSAVEQQNLDVFKFLIENDLATPDITLKNKNGESLREFIERYSISDCEQKAAEIAVVYRRSENRILLKSLTGELNAGVQVIFRTLCNNWRNNKFFWKEAFFQLLTWYRVRLIWALYAFALVTFWILCYLRS